MRQNIQEYFRILGVNPGVGPLEIRRAYRHLVQSWHPDLFKPGSPMQATAEDITKEINQAFEQLYRKKLYRKFLPRTEAVSEVEKNGTDRANPGAEEAGSHSPLEAEPVQPARRRPVLRAWFARKISQARKGKLFRRPRHIPWAKATAAAGLAVLLVPIWQKSHDRAAVESAMMEEASRQTEAAPAGNQAPAERKDSRPAESALDDVIIGREKEPSGTGSQAMMPIAALFSSPSGPAFRALPTDAVLDVFEMGDPKSKVLAIQGVPDEASENVLRYGSSIVYLNHGAVSGWSDQLPRLRIRKWTTIESALNTFTFGSTMREVVRAQGIPSEFTPHSYTYGTSVIFFDNDRVSGWSDGDVPLRSFDFPSSPFVDIDRLTSTASSAGRNPF
jgi:curved DNA-binding protein CbpA